MLFTRRVFIKFLSLALLLRPSSWLSAAPAAYDFKETLIAFLDTLMPAEETPAASELEIHKILLQKSETDKRYARLLLNGCLWLENAASRRHRTNFGALTEQQRIPIVELMEQAEQRTVARAFFDRVQADLFDAYYSHPASWKGLGIHRPPQPHGYPGYHEPPAVAS